MKVGLEVKIEYILIFSWWLVFGEFSKFLMKTQFDDLFDCASMFVSPNCLQNEFACQKLKFIIYIDLNMWHKRH